MNPKLLPKLSDRATLAAWAFCLSLNLAAPGLIGAAEARAPQPIFNGKDLTGWKVPSPNPFWRVVEGVLIGENDEKLKGHVLYTEKTYGDFILETEARWNGEIDSGIIFRLPELQLQIGVSRSLKTDMTCSFYTGGKDKYPQAGRARNVDKLLKAGDWNIIRLQAKGDTYTVWLNGERVDEYRDPKYAAPGPIGLQIHPGLKMKVEFRNLKLTE